MALFKPYWMCETYTRLNSREKAREKLSSESEEMLVKIFNDTPNDDLKVEAVRWMSDEGFLKEIVYDASLPHGYEGDSIRLAALNRINDTMFLIEAEMLHDSFEVRERAWKRVMT